MNTNNLVVGIHSFTYLLERWRYRMCEGISVSQEQGQRTPPSKSGSVKSPTVPAAITVGLVGRKPKRVT